MITLEERAAMKDRQWDSETQRWVYPLAASLVPAMRQLLLLSEDDRRSVFFNFCLHCGSTDTNCQCANDT